MNISAAEKPVIAIVGAGIGGLSAALALARTGFEPVVFEQAPELGEVGAGLSLSPNAVKGLRFLGIESDLMAMADIPPRQITRHYQTGEILVDIDRADTPEQFGAPYLQMHRADLHALLTDAFRAICPDSISLGKTLVRVAERADAVELAFEDGTSFEANVAVGADGLKSTMRQQVFQADAPAFSGFVAWRGLVAGSALSHLEFLPGSCVHAGPNRLFVRYPVRGGDLQNFVAFARTNEWKSEGWSQTGSIEEAMSYFGDFVPEVRAVLSAVPGGTCHRWGLFSREPLPQWVTDRVAVIGDAAHPMLPWFGQGAASAIEDAVVLARAFSLADSPIEALQRYERARKDRVTLIHRESALGGERLAGQATSALRDKPVRTEDTLGITSYDPATVPV
jgi:salicylate hydroxylase